MSKRPQSGFTLVELMVALAVAAILLGVGVPSFSGAIKDARLNKPWGELRQSLFLARSEAVKGSRVVTVCVRKTDTTCDNDASADWANGWLVFVTDGASPAGTVGAGEILRVTGPINDQIDVAAFGSSTRTASGADDRAAIHYLATGEADSEWQNGTFVFCDDREEDHAIGINIALTGDIRSARPGGSSEVVLDVFGREVDCP